MGPYGDVAATTVCSGNVLIHTVSAPGADHSANALWGTHTDKESLASRQVADCPTHVSMRIRENEHERVDSVNVPRNVNTHLLGATPHDGDGAGVTSSFWETGSCPGVEGVVGGANFTACSAFFDGPP